MTEQEWLQATDPKPMLEFLKGKASDRKLRLFACACVWEYVRFMAFPHSDTHRIENGLDISERYADGLTTQDEWWRGTREGFHFSPWNSEHVYDEAVNAVITAGGVASWHDSKHYCKEQERDELERLTIFFRCIFGLLPFRPITINPAWLTWHGGLLVSMARQMYDSRDFSDLLVLADALEEAGCTEPDILRHCREPGPHVRGCWVVDTILGKT